MKLSRMSRVDSEIQTALSETITYNLSSSELSGCIISVISVHTSKDLRHARVLISIFPDKDKEKKFNAIKNAIPFLRKEVARKVSLRIVPELQFEIDNSAEYGAKIDSLIEKLHNQDGTND